MATADTCPAPGTPPPPPPPIEGIILSFLFFFNSHTTRLMYILHVQFITWRTKDLSKVHIRIPTCMEELEKDWVSIINIQQISDESN